jgi:hypothetical protein
LLGGYVSFHNIQKPEALLGAAAETVPAVADAATTQLQSISATPNQPTEPSQVSPNDGKRKASVALQQKSKGRRLLVAPAKMFASVDYKVYTDEELHNATVAALVTYKKKREEADNYAYDVLIPALNQIIHRYKQQGRATPYRLNGCPTVEKYFEGIGLNYSTVRSWKSRTRQRLLQAASDAGTKPAPAGDPDPIPQFNKSVRKALIEGNHRAVEIVAALEAGRDVQNEIADFKVVMNAKRLDDILQAYEKEPDYKGILTKVVQVVVDMKASLPDAFVRAVRELTESCKFRTTAAPVAPHNGARGAGQKRMQIAPIPQKPPAYVPLQPGRKYTVRHHPQGGFGIYEPSSTVSLQKHETEDSAWDAIEASATAALALREEQASAPKEAIANV